VNEETGIIIVSTNGWDQRLTNLSNDLKNYGAPVIAIAGLEDRSKVEVSDWMPTLQVHSLLTPIIYVIPLQLFAYYSSIIRGLNPDKPEKLSKVVEE
jgi:glucosamine--fructose-6-phosphate aminotransferase (isomerizing)